MSSEGIPTVTVQQASARLTEGGEQAPVIVDVREADEFAVVRVEGVTHVPMSGFTQHAGELPMDRPLLILCASGARSAAVTGYLRRSGWTDVANIEGGINAWQKAGLPVQRGPQAAG